MILMDDYYKHRRHGINYIRSGAEEIDPKGHATDLFTSWACDYIAERGKEKQPFFLYLAYNAPHTPTQPPKEWLEKVRAREKGMDAKRAKLVALIEHLDDGVGRVVAALKTAGVKVDHEIDGRSILATLQGLLIRLRRADGSPTPA